MSNTSEPATLSSKEASCYTLTEATNKLEVSKTTIYNWVNNGKLNCIILSNGSKRYDVEEFFGRTNITAVVEESTVPNTTNTFIIEDEQTGQLIFKSDLTNGKELRIFGTYEEPLFVAKDVAEMLGYKDTKKAVEDDKLTYNQYKVNRGGETPPLFEQSKINNPDNLADGKTTHKQ